MCDLTVQGVNDVVNRLNDQALYACDVKDIERQIDAAVTASRAALASVCFRISLARAQRY